MLVTVSGLFLVAMALTNKPVTRWLVGVGRRYVRRHLVPALAERPENLLLLSEDFAIQAVRLEADVEETRSLSGMAHALPGLTVLGIRRGSEYFGEPPVDIGLHQGDELIVYGRAQPDEVLP